MLFIDDRASDEQFDALVAMLTGELGGPLADLAALVGERVAIVRAPNHARGRGRAGNAPDRRGS